MNDSLVAIVLCYGKPWTQASWFLSAGFFLYPLLPSFRKEQKKKREKLSRSKVCSENLSTTTLENAWDIVQSR
jgi:hypothetical protein